MKTRFTRKMLVTFLLWSSLGVAKESTPTMRQIFGALMELQPIATDSKALADPANRAKVEKTLSEIQGFNHAIPKEWVQADPGAATIAKLFSGYLKDTQRSFHAGRYEETRYQLQTITGFCFQCHARIHSEKAFQDAAAQVETLSLKPFAKAQFLAATRQFDLAWPAYESFLTSAPTDERGLVEFTRAMRQALTVGIRMKKDPKLTLGLVQNLSKRSDLPQFVKFAVTNWKRDLEAWAKEGKAPATPTAKVKLAEKLIERGGRLNNFPADDMGDVLYLRAAGYLTSALEENPKGSYREKALYLLGICHLALRDPFFWNMEQLYFEACIREFPHSKTAAKCYQKYADQLYFGFTGSGGTFVPEDEADKLKALRILSEQN